MKQVELTEEMLASKGQRILHYFIDILAVYAIFFVFAFVALFIGAALGSSAEETLNGPDWKYNVAFVILYLAYCAVFEAIGARTLGKLITGTIVVTEYGEKPEVGTIIRRTLCRLIPFDALSFLGDTGWHDSISGTRVVKKHIYIIRQKEVIELDEIGEKSEIL